MGAQILGGDFQLGDVEGESLEQLQNFMAWASKYQKSYPTKEEFLRRFKVFLGNIESLGAFIEQARGDEKFIGAPSGMHELELNKFADLTEEEYKALLGFKYDPATRGDATVEPLTAEGDLPASINWAEKGFVSPVKDQGACGSCWSFSTTGAIESALQIKTGGKQLFSEQQLIDCSISFGNNGCSGGLVEYAFNYAKHVPMETETQYPYKAANQKCAQAELEGDLQISDFKEVQRFNPEQLAQALNLGPVSVGVDASGVAFKFYKSGVIKKWCGTSIDHAVLAVGYGTDSDGSDYWLVKNSWGGDWGEHGYFRVLRDMSKEDEGTCGILQTPSYPIV
uniref:Uncharacterized protein n=1 Tax=Strombidium rassoulzadegani TaxID=1082188 RepID=A0A7S3CIY7_9SPIT